MPPLLCLVEKSLSKARAVRRKEAQSTHPHKVQNLFLPARAKAGGSLAYRRKPTKSFKKKWHPHRAKTHQETQRCAPPQDSSPTQDIHHQPTRINLPDALSLLRTAPEAVGIGLGCLPREAFRDGGSHHLWRPEGPLDFRTAVQRDLTVCRSETHPGV